MWVESCHGIQLKGPTGLGLDTRHWDLENSEEIKKNRAVFPRRIGSVGADGGGYLSQRRKQSSGLVFSEVVAGCCDADGDVGES